MTFRHLEIFMSVYQNQSITKASKELHISQPSVSLAIKELEEKYLRIIPGEMEWNHIYTIFFSLEMTENKEACMRLLEEWDGDWQKSPNVFLVASSPPPDKLYKVKNIPKGAAGQEVSLLIKPSKKQQKIKSAQKHNTENLQISNYIPAAHRTIPGKKHTVSDCNRRWKNCIDR